MPGPSTRPLKKGTNMKRLLVGTLAPSAMLALAMVLLMVPSASAQTTITWTGQGSENLPCEDGGHWVLTGQGITSATLTVNGVTYTMVQSGGGSWSADSTGALGAGTTASATYEGTVENGNPQLVLSHCNPAYPPPVGSQGVAGEQVAGEQVAGQQGGTGPAVAAEGALAFTGAELAILFTLLAGLLIAGTGVLIASRRRAARSAPER
jgi:hypothetical protein